MVSSARLGDGAHIFILVNTVAFMAAVIMQALGIFDCFSASWSADGFCIAHKDNTINFFGLPVPLSSHALKAIRCWQELGSPRPHDAVELDVADDDAQFTSPLM